MNVAGPSSVAEPEQLLQRVNDTHRPLQPDDCLHVLFEAQARRSPEATAVVSEGRAVSFGRLRAWAAGIAESLGAAGVEQGHFVGVCGAPSAGVIASILGILRCGAVYVPLDPEWPSERLRFMARDCDQRVAVCDSEHAALVAELGLAPVVIEESSDHPEPPRPPAQDPGELAYVLYTSGSTGAPKGVAVPHRAVNRLVSGAPAYVELGPGCRFLWLSPLTFDASVIELWGPLLTGGAIVVMPRGPAWLERLAETIQDDGVTAALFISPQLHMIVDRDPHALRGLRHVLVGGDVLSPDHVRRLLASGVIGEVVHCYGPTETTLFATVDLVRKVGSEDVSLPIGTPIENTTCHVVDEQLRPVGIGVAGELLIGGLGVARGYVNRPELTSQKFVPDHLSERGSGMRLYRTGDLVRWRPDGRLEFLGRIDDQVKIRGYRIEPAEIEAVLRSHDRIEDCVVLAREDEPGRKLLVAYVVATGPQPLDVPHLREFVAARLPEYMIPAAWVMLEALPLTANSKVDRAALPAPGDPPSRADGRPVRNPLERRVAELFAEVLRVDGIGPGEGFFELGGDSLLATEVIARLGKEAGVGLPLDVLADAPTPATLARVIERSQATPRAPAFPALVPQQRRTTAPLSVSQEQICFLGELDPSSLAWQFQATVWLHGTLDVAALTEALSGIVARHEIYRSTFPRRNGGWVALIHDPFRVDLTVEDLRDGEDGEAALAELAAAHYRHPIATDRLPLVRWRLVRLGPTRHALLHAEHHLVHDGWSMMVFLRELRELYAAAVERRSARLSPPSLQYSDFAVWQRALLDSEVARAQLDYWTERLADPPEPLELPYDRPRPARQTFRGDQLCQTIEPDLAERLRGFAREQGATLFMTMFAAFVTLLHRYSGQGDIIVGSGVANRRLRELEGLLGMFVNTVALRTDVGADPNVTELLARVRGAVLEAQAHQEVPFTRVVEAVAPERSASQAPLYQTLFSFADTPLPDLHAPGLEIVPDETPGNGSAKAEINVVVVNHEGRAAPGEGSELTIVWEYNSDLFSAEAARRMLAHYGRLLEALVAEPECRLSELQLVPEEERHRLLVEWNDTVTDYPREATIHGCFEEAAHRSHDRVAVVAGSDRITYRDLDRRSNQLARHLRARGVREGARVGVSLERSPVMVVALLGILKAGGAYVPIDPADPAERREFITRDAAISLVLDSDLLEDPAIRADSTDGLEARVGATDDAYVMYTSGSTGEPKGVVVTHRNVVRLVTGQSYADFGPDEVFLQLGPLAFDASTFEIWGALLHGARLVLYTAGPIDLAELRVTLERHGVTTLFLTTALFHQVVERAIASLKGLKQLLAGGDVMLPAQMSRARRELPGVKLLHVYGPTEATTFSSCFEVSGTVSVDCPVPIGRPIANSFSYVLGEDLEPVPIGVPGELYIGGDGVARGYLQRPELTQERFIPNPFGLGGDRLYRTGDLVRWHADGNLEFIGREDLQVKVRGFRLEPGEVESALGAHPDVREAAVVAPADADGDRRVVAFVVSEPGLADAELRSFLAGKLPAYMVPSAFVLVESLPLTPNGKVDRSALASAAKARKFESTAPSDSARAPVEQVVGEIWAEVLGVDAAGPEDDFFDSGGHSLLALTLIDRVNKAFGVELAVRSFLVEPTVAAVVREVEQADGGQGPVAPPPSPQVSVEQVVGEIWAEVLGVDAAGPEDDFFDSGGHSLLALTLIDRVNKAFGVELAVRSFLVEPTVAAVVREVESARGEGAPPVEDPPVVPAPSTGEGSSPGAAAGFVPPRTPVERVVGDLWAELVGVEAVGVEDDLFDSGGTSQLVLRLIEDVNDAFGVDLPVESLLVEPKVSAVVQEVERARQREGAAPADEHPPVVPIRPGGDLPPLFLVAGGIGGEVELLVYARLARYLDRRQPFYGLRARGVDDLTDPHDSVDAMAAEHLEEIRKVQPNGPYFIGGSCMGGMVAFELATQLRALGEDVALLVLLDSPFPSWPGYLRARVKNVWHYGLRQALERSSAQGAAAVLREAVRLRVAPTEAQRVVRRKVAIGQRYLRRMLNYRPRRYDGKLTLVACEERSAMDAARGWRDFAPAGLDIRYIPGDHFTHLRDHAATTAACLDDCLRRAREEHERAMA